HFDWSALYDEAKLPQGELNVEQPAFLAQFEKELAQTPLPAWRTYLRWQLLASAAPWLSKAFVEESFAFDQKYLAGVAELKPRWRAGSSSSTTSARPSGNPRIEGAGA